MSLIRKHLRLVIVGASCAVIGAGASAIAAAGAAGTQASGHAKKHRVASPLRRVLAGAVQGDAVVYTKSGFVTVSFERGFVQSVNGQELTMTEATKKATYKTVTLTIPGNARVRDDGRKATLSELTQGQHVLVVQGPKRWVVIARNVKTS